MYVLVGPKAIKKSDGWSASRL